MELQRQLITEGADVRAYYNPDLVGHLDRLVLPSPDFPARVQGVFGKRMERRLISTYTPEMQVAYAVAQVTTHHRATTYPTILNPPRCTWSAIAKICGTQSFNQQLANAVAAATDGCHCCLSFAMDRGCKPARVAKNCC